MKVVDDFGNLLFVAPPGKVISYHHVVLFYQATSPGKYVCADCGLVWMRGEDPGRCELKYEFATSGWGDKDSRLKSKQGFYTW